MNRKPHLFVEKITPVEFCGQTFAWKLDASIFELPFETEPTSGKDHDFKKCKKCQESLKTIEEFLTKKFKGTITKAGFPLCCAQHANLTKLPKFLENKIHYDRVPTWVAQKVIFTNNHILNHIKRENWYAEVIEYIDYTIASFGQMPKEAGEPLYLSDYFAYVLELLGRPPIPKDKKDKLQSYIEGFSRPSEDRAVDLQELATTYQKWLEIFPFDLSYFKGLRQHYEKALPILTGAPITNHYLGTAKIRLHTKESLIDVLIDLTNDFITRLNGLTLYEKGQLTEPLKLQMELILEERRTKCRKIGYHIVEEDETTRYAKMLSEWLNDEIAFIERITPIIENLPEQPIVKFDDNTTRIIKAFNEYGFQEFLRKSYFDPNKIYDLIAENSGREFLPYTICLLNELAYIDYFMKEYVKTKEKAYKIFGEILNADPRRIRGNINVLNPRSNENPSQYTSGSYTETIKKKLKEIKQDGI